MITNRLRRNAALTETVNNKVIKVTTSNERGNNARLQRNNVRNNCKSYARASCSYERRIFKSSLRAAGFCTRRRSWGTVTTFAVLAAVLAGTARARRRTMRARANRTAMCISARRERGCAATFVPRNADHSRR